MIYVTVGTHEQQFNRLIQCVDELKGNGIIEEEVVIQKGYCTYTPLFSEYKDMYSYDELQQKLKAARIVITHGGPSSFIQVLQTCKIPIVVPRSKNFKEHVNNHQLEFCRAVSERYHNIILVEDIADLKDTILNYDSIVKGMSGGMTCNNAEFMKGFELMLEDMF